MRGRVLRRFDWAAAAAAERQLVDRCVSAALARREQCLPDEEDPRFLHPARTMLILMDDAGERDATVLAAAALIDSVDPALAVSEAVRTLLPETVQQLGAAVPLPRSSPGDLLEALVTAPAAVRRIACAERLDQARHAHMLPDFDGARWLAEVRTVYLPVAARTHERIALRFERWALAWERRL